MGHAHISSLEILSQELKSLLNYAVNLVDTLEGFLKNLHYDVTLEVNDSETDQPVSRATLQKGKWTSNLQSAAEAMTYHYLMYQKEWMELNSGIWFASNKGITVVAIDSDPEKFNNAYWISANNKISLGLVKFARTSSEIVTYMALDGSIVLHEAGHANVYYANPLRSFASLQSFCSKHTSCETKSCDIEKIKEEGMCCVNAQGCYFGINEGQADFHAAMIFENRPKLFELRYNIVNDLLYPSCRLSIDPRYDTDTTIQQAFSCQSGQIHTMGRLIYNKIWYEIYTHSATNKVDIATLFTEHLPLLTYDDDFETAGLKIFTLAGQIFPDKSEYQDVILNAFQKRKLEIQKD